MSMKRNTEKGCDSIRTVYFVCHGNTCRSPMAGEIFRQILKERGDSDTVVDCFGTNPYYPDNPDVKRLREAAVTEVMGGLEELPRHVPKGMDGLALREHDVLVMLNPSELHVLEEQLSGTGVKVKVLVWDIEDPFRKPLEKYIESARSMKEAIEGKLNLSPDASGSGTG